MSTSFLTRDELHARVDALFDRLEDRGDDPIAVSGQLVGDLEAHAPTESKDYFRARPMVGFAPYAFDGGAFALGEAIRDGTRRDLLGTVIVDRSELGEQVVEALAVLEEDDADPEEIAAGIGGEDGAE